MKIHRHCVWNQEAQKAEAERKASGSEVELGGGDWPPVQWENL